jgi:fibronectin-binding autotransporter adhesin
MFLSLYHWLNRRSNCPSKRAKRRGRALRWPRSFALILEQIEDRLAPALMIWSGLGSTPNWSDPGNWLGNIAPAAGDSLLFPDAVSNQTAVNDLPANTLFGSIAIRDGGYAISGNPIRLFGAIAATHTTGNSSFTAPITLLTATNIVTGNAGATLTLGAIDTGEIVGTTGILGTTALTIDGAGNTVISGTLAGRGSLLKLGAGELALTAANTIEGIITIQQGTVRVTNNAALGAVTGHTSVLSGASLILDASGGALTIAEPLSLAEGGVGFGTPTTPSGLGALRAIAGNSVYTGGIELASNVVIGVDAGTTLDISGRIVAPTTVVRQLTKVGQGTLRLSGSQSNVYTGTTTVLEGILELNKSPGINAIGGALTIGDNFSGDNNATVRWLASNQIPELDFYQTTLLTTVVNASGFMDLNGFNETIGALTLLTGPTFSADVATGSGILTLGGSVTLNAFPGTSGQSPAATISGHLDLGSFLSGGVALTERFFTVNDTQLSNIAPDLEISANISGSPNIQLNKTGGGTLLLSGNNTYSGPTAITAGILGIGSDTAFGTGLVALGSATIYATNGPRTIANPLSLDGNPIIIGNTDLTFTGLATLTGGRTITVVDPSQTTTFAGGIGEGIFGPQNFAKAGRGTLRLTSPLTHSGSTTINNGGGRLALAGTAGAITNTIALTIGVDATLEIDDSTLLSSGDRINPFTSITNNGRFRYIPNPSGSTLNLGPFTAGGSLASTLEIDNPLGVDATVILSSVNFSSPINFVGTGTALSTNPSVVGGSRIVFIVPTSNLTSGILPTATVTDATLSRIDFATVVSAPEGFAITRLPNSGYVTDINQAGPASNVRLSAGTHLLTASRTINSLILEDGAILQAAPGVDAVLTVIAGISGVSPIIMSPNSIINLPVLNLAAATAIITVTGDALNDGPATISSRIVGATSAFNKSGRGRLVLSGNNAFAGSMNINEGIVVAANATALGGGTVTVRQGATLDLDGGFTFPFQALNVSGTGFSTPRAGDFSSGIGAVRNLSGTNVWNGPVALGGDPVDLSGVLSGFPAFANLVCRFHTESGTRLILNGVISGGGQEFIKTGAGTIEFGGGQSNVYSGATRVLEGVLELNKLPGVVAIPTTAFIGDQVSPADTAILRYQSSHQIPDSVLIQVNPSGWFDLNNQTDIIGQLPLVIGANGAGRATLGSGTLTINTGTYFVFTDGVGHSSGATIEGGTLALTVPGTTAATTRTFQVNDGAIGDDLTITSTIVNGSELTPLINVTKTGFGTLVFGGNTSNTYTGTTQVSEGELALAKTGGALAIAGAVVVGDNNNVSGYARSDVLRLRASNQIADFTAPVTVNGTGWFDLNGFDETIGNADTQPALTISSGLVSSGTGTLTVNGNITFFGAVGTFGNSSYLIAVAPEISGTLNLGSLSRTIDVADRGELAMDAIISANITASGSDVGIVKTNFGFLLLSGNNTYSGDTFLTNGHLAVGSNTALGTGRIYHANDCGITAFGGARELSNPLFLFGNLNNTTNGIYNDLRFTGLTTLTLGSTIIVPSAVTYEFAGGITEIHGSRTLAKSGFGTMIISSPALHSGDTNVNTNGGTLILRDEGTLRNTNNITISQFGTFMIDNLFGTNRDNRIYDSRGITLAGGRISFMGAPGQASSELLGTLTLNSNLTGEVETLISPSTGSSGALTFGSLTRLSK